MVSIFIKQELGLGGKILRLDSVRARSSSFAQARKNGLGPSPEPPEQNFRSRSFDSVAISISNNTAHLHCPLNNEHLAGLPKKNKKYFFPRMKYADSN